MSRKKSNSPGTKAVLVTMVAALVGVAAIAAYVQMTPAAGRVADDLRKDRPAVSRPAEPASEVRTPSRHSRSQEPILLVPAMDGEEVKLGAHVSPAPQGVDLKAHLVTETFKSLGISEGRALRVEIQDKVANIDVNAAMVQHGYGSMQEGNLIKALQLALGQLKDVDKFKLLQDGQPIELGHMELSEPIDVIRSYSP